MSINTITYSTVATLKEDTSISQNVDAKSLLPYISSSELMHVQPIIGVALDSELKTQIENNTLSGDNFTLVEFYVRPVSAMASWYSSTIFQRSKATNKGIVHQSSDSSDTISFEDFQLYRSNIKNQLIFFENRLTKFLEDNQTTYPTYRSDCELPTHNDSSGGLYIY